ncbi:hypothetical protein [Hoeflea marina]|uniref:hypothetical protein n=1 Tax=Hoeflea marina TaxID=274592 RepID=UPI0011B41DAE|nr:hypothetical protein [Hoeflea marina]
MADTRDNDRPGADIPAPIVWRGMEALLNDDRIAGYLIEGTNRGMNRGRVPDCELHDPDWWQHHNTMLCELLHRLIVEISWSKDD